MLLLRSPGTGIEGPSWNGAVAATQLFIAMGDSILELADMQR
jgi:hypothetical protein